jgi:hypothetical protein
VGDLRGITSRLKEMQWIGIDSIFVRTGSFSENSESYSMPTFLSSLKNLISASHQKGFVSPSNNLF